MSLPLTRRIARTALLIAAGAVPMVAAAGSASAAELPAAPDLGGLSALDHAGTTVDGVAQQATGKVGDAGGKAAKKAVPAAGKKGGKHAKPAKPAAQKAAGDVAGTAGSVLGDAAGSAGEGLPTGQLPLQGLPLG
ncbi:ATP-binding protein [Streptomyces sp. CWNU-52B]|uniref:ATP-binding protein n=1 Tax=unclassified Streptomyces TaxID=2593676 RepID=UPI0039BEF602